jgi:hypothetical protein
MPACLGVATYTTMASMLRASVLLAGGAALVAGHASMVQPPPRNAVDKDLAPWNSFTANQSDWNHHVDTPICPIASGAPGDALDALSLRNGQACFYFSHGRRRQPRPARACEPACPSSHA